MATATHEATLPRGVGQLTRGWLIFVLAMVAVSVLGWVAYIREYTEGMTVTGMRNVGTMGGATWGLYITFVVYFIGVSFAGIAIAAVIRLFNLERLRPLARMAEVLTVVSLILGAIAIVADLGQPLRGMVNLFRYARPQSPFFGTFTMVIAGYLFASLVYLWLTSRRDAALLARQPSRLTWLHRLVAAGYTDTPAERERHSKATFWLAVSILPMLVVAHSTLGFVFGLQVGRPGWYSALQAPAFVVLAGVSGTGVLIVLAAIVRKSIGRDVGLTDYVFGWLGRFMMLLLFVYVYFMVTELLTATYAGSERELQVTREMLWGEYSWIFWSSVALLVLPLLGLLYQSLKSSWTVSWLVVSGIAVNIGAIGKRYLIAVPSQTHGQLLPYTDGSYSPSWIEWAVVASLVAFGALVIGIFMKVLPIVELNHEEEVSHA
ncbi:MAG: NrfD/PsrC family molybdoenzyme membrane anchor subunit [Gemmatimonadales bacterium]